MTIFSTAYLPSISYMSCLVKERDVVIEAQETYLKQSYRTRCKVMTANDTESLIVPVVRPNGCKSSTREVLVDYATNWQQIHRRCLESAYRAAPYFEHYYPYFAPLFDRKHDTLLSLNEASLNAVFKALKLSCNISYSNTYEKVSTGDYRDLFHPKRPFPAEIFTPYYQVFDTKWPFRPDLSIIDLIFNEGPGALPYLKKLNIPLNHEG